MNSNHIKYYRGKQRHSLQSLADEAEISKSTIHEIERGEAEPKLYTAYKIASALNLPVTTVFPPNDKLTQAMGEE